MLSFDSGLIFVDLAGLELPMYTTLTLDPHGSTCLCLLNAEIQGVYFIGIEPAAGFFNALLYSASLFQCCLSFCMGVWYCMLIIFHKLNINFFSAPNTLLHRPFFPLYLVSLFTAESPLL